MDLSFVPAHERIVTETGGVRVVGVWFSAITCRTNSDPEAKPAAYDVAGAFSWKVSGNPKHLEKGKNHGLS